MAEALSWYQVIPPRDVELESLTGALRVLATRPRLGFMGRTPLVVLELWGVAGRVHWLLGVETRLASEITGALRAHLPRLGLVLEHAPLRPAVRVASELRQRGFSHPLRTDMAAAVATALQDCVRSLGKDEVSVVQWLLGPSQNRSRQPEAFRPLETVGVRKKSTPDAGARRNWLVKAEEPLFAVRARLGATASQSEQSYAIVRRLAGGLSLANSPQSRLYAQRPSLAVASALNAAKMPRTWAILLSASEVAALQGWPVQEDVAADLPVVGGHINPVPRVLLVEDADSHRKRVLGESLHPAERGRLVTMPMSSSLHHLHLIGPTGSGKSTLLANLILADIQAGHGTLVVEPRGDLVEDLLLRLPEDRHSDVVVIDPADTSSGVIGLNILAGPVETAERRADELVGSLAAMAGSNWGPRTADVALHAILTVARLPDGTLPDVVALLTHPAFRRRVLSMVNDPLVLGPWWSAYEALSDGERAQHIAPLLNKLRSLLSRQTIRQMLGQPQSRFSFDDLFTKRRIVLVNLNRGQLGGPAASLLGALVLSQVWSALQRRASIPRGRRHPVGLYVDEFQDYVDITGGIDFGDALAQSRGLGGAWTIAHQHFAQLSSKLEAALIANARSRISFHPATDDAKALAVALGGGLTAEDLLRLHTYQAVANIHLSGQPALPFTVQTRALGPCISDTTALRQASARTYGVPGPEVDRALTDRWNASDSSGRIGSKPRSRA